MTLLQLRELSHAYGHAPLLDEVGLTLERNERICLLGRNGAGKSTLLKVIAGEVRADSGTRDAGELRIGYVPQDFPAGQEGSVREVVRRSAAALVADLDRYDRLSTDGSADQAGLQRLHERIDAAEGWTLDTRVSSVIEQLDLDAEQPVHTLSGGQQRRVLLASALLQAPELMVLDEPTNHLDLANIEWLENWLLQFQGCSLFTTHDRRLIETVATRILELDRGQLTSWPGDYANYLRRRAEREQAEERANARADRLLAQEERWIRQGIKARRTRNEGRVRRLEQLREVRVARRERVRGSRLGSAEAVAGSKLVAELTDVSLQLGERRLISHLDMLLMRGDRVGIVGPNGSGKTTLLRLLLGELKPDSGEVRRADALTVAYFDQFRRLPDEGARVRDQLGDGSDYVGSAEPRQHVMSYLQEFLFAPERANAPVSVLSGGERARLALARLFAEPGHLLVLDEPTNDLDIETLELLEERLLDYNGTLLLVTHDRAFLDNVVTSVLVFEGDGEVQEHAGGYTEYLERQRRRRAAAPASVPAAPAREPKPARGAARTAKLSYKEQRELEQLPAQMETLEHEIAAVQARLADPALYREAPQEVTALQARLAAAETALEQSFERWEALEARSA